MSEENKNERVVLEATVKNPNKKPQVIKLNEAHATMDIAKNLIQDYTFLITMSVVKTIFRQLRNPDDVLKNIYETWEKRMSAQIAEETENYKKAITDAFEGSESNVTEEVAKEIKEYMDTYCHVRDNAVKMAKDGIMEINKLIIEKPQNKEEK